MSTVGGLGNALSYVAPFVRVEMRSAIGRLDRQRHVLIEPATCTEESCSASLTLGSRETLGTPSSHAESTPPAGRAWSCDDLGCHDVGAYTVDDIERITLEFLNLGCDQACQDAVGNAAPQQCSSTWDDDRAPRWTIQSIAVDGSHGKTYRAIPLARLGVERRARLHASVAIAARSSSTIATIGRTPHATCSRLGS